MILFWHHWSWCGHHVSDTDAFSFAHIEWWKCTTLHLKWKGITVRLIFSSASHSFRVEEAEVVCPDGKTCKYPVLYSLQSSYTVSLKKKICYKPLLSPNPAVCTSGAGLQEREVVQRVHQQKSWHKVSCLDWLLEIETYVLFLYLRCSLFCIDISGQIHRLTNLIRYTCTN